MRFLLNSTLNAYMRAFLWSGCSLLLCILPQQAEGHVSEKEASELGLTLTPMGAEQAGNREGTIPAWVGGIIEIPANYKNGDHHPDPFSDDKILYTITGENLEQFEDHLSPGQIALLTKYPSYKMPVYESRRSASFPPSIYKATIANAIKAELIEDGNVVTNSIIGIPFPIPKNGNEIMWNHLLRYRGNANHQRIDQAVVTRSGDYTLIKLEDWMLLPYSNPSAVSERLENINFYFKEKYHGPARAAGFMTLIHETLNQVTQPRRAWIYEPGRRRINRFPYLAYDVPYPHSDGLLTGDQADMFNGALDRFQWESVGKKELYVPYNSYLLHSDQWLNSDIIRPLHINQDLARYELHRVWIVESVLKKNMRHIYPRRTFYIDEDSWQVLLVDVYNEAGKIWRVSEGHAINYFEVPTFWTTLEVHYDLFAGRYVARGLDNENPMYDFSVNLRKSDFVPSALLRESMR